MNDRRKQRIAIDMDEVLADTLSHFLAEYNREFGDTITKSDLVERKLADIIPADQRARLRHYALSPGFFRSIPLMPGSAEVFAELRERYEVFIATAAMEFPSSYNEKYPVSAAGQLARHPPSISLNPTDAEHRILGTWCTACRATRL